MDEGNTDQKQKREEDLRLFIALPLDSAQTEQIVSLQNELKEKGVTGRWIPQCNLHVTLAFIGETDRKQELEAILKSLPFPSCSIAFDLPDLFGNALVLKGKADEKLEGYVSALKEELKKAGFSISGKPFKAHITLARKVSQKEMPVCPKNLTALNFRWDQLALYASYLESSGARYVILHVFSAAC